MATVDWTPFFQLPPPSFHLNHDENLSKNHDQSITFAKARQHGCKSLDIADRRDRFAYRW